jgi:nucleoside-diphosphate-sugar epimerase
VAIRRSKTLHDVQHPPLVWKTVDVQNSVALQDALVGVDAVVHTAALVSFNPRKRNEIFNVNVAGTKNVVDSCLSLNIRKLIHISSVAALGRKKGKEVLDENAQWVDSPLNSVYAQSKYLAELEVYRGIEEGLEAAIINPSLILAPVEWNRSSSKIFEYVWQEKKLYPSGIANYVDVNDVVAIICVLLEQHLSGERFIASAGSIPYQQLFAEIAKRFNKQPPSIKANPALLPVAALLEETKSWLLQKEPTLTRESIKSATAETVYLGKKAQDKLGIQYKTLAQTLDLCCDYFLHTYSIKKA